MRRVSRLAASPRGRAAQLFNGLVEHDPSLMNHYDSVTETFHIACIMGSQQYGLTLLFGLFSQNIANRGSGCHINPFVAFRQDPILETSILSG